MSDADCTPGHELRSVAASFIHFFVFLHQISPEPLNGFAQNSQGGRVWSLARMSLEFKVEDQRSRSPGTKSGFWRSHHLPPAATSWSYLLHAAVTLTFEGRKASEYSARPI